ncbi:MATE family efflux transporter [Intestinibacter sp.]
MEISQKINYLFSNADLKKLIGPLIVEQLLLIIVGLVDSIMVASVGEAAVSAVSLVDTIMVLITQVFIALGTGGAVVAGQYLGQKNEKKSCEASDQLMLFLMVSSVGIMILGYILKNFILYKVFGTLENDVMNYATTYLLIVFLSIPGIAIYNGAAALFRAMGNSKVTMKISILMNSVNFVGNALLIYGLKWGVVGAAVPTVLSRYLAAIIAFYLIRNQSLQIHISEKMSFRFDRGMIKRILYIGIPNGLENSMFQLGKIVVLNLVASFGTAAIAANAVSNCLALFQIVPGMAIGQADLAVVSQCVGADDEYQTRYYTKKMLKLTYIGILITNIIIFITLNPILDIYNLSQETARITRDIIIYHGIMAIIFWPLSFMIANTLRASNDVKFCMIVCILSMWIFRIGFSYIIGKYMGLGVFGVWVAMTIDWVVRSGFFVWRYLSGRWKLHWY